MWLYIYFPHLLLESAYQHLLHCACLMVVDPKSNLIVDVNAQAQEAGVEIGMNLQTAICLCPDVIPIHMDSALQQDALAVLTNKVRHVSAWVSQDGADGIYVEVASMHKLLGSAEEIAQTITQRIHPLTCIIAAAPYAQSARFLARAHISVFLNTENLRTYLGNLAIEDTIFSLDDKYAISRLGIQKLSELMRLRPSDLAFRLSLPLAKELDVITGKTKWFPKPQPIQKLFNKKIELEFEIENAQQLFFPIRNLLTLLCDYLVEHSMQSNKTIIRCHHRDALPSQLHLALATPTQNVDEWLYILRHELQRFTPQAPIMELHMLCKWFHPMDAHAHSLLTKDNQYDAQALKSLINKLDARMGHQHYYFLQESASPWPETHTIKRPTQPEQEPNKTTAYHNRPVFLLNQPAPVNRENYKLLQGPERMEGGWWYASDCKRDYYIAEHSQGALHWLYRDQYQQWFLHGLFS